MPDTEAFNLLLEACANTNSTYDALRVFGWMLLGKGFVEDIHVPNGITFNLVIKYVHPFRNCWRRSKLCKDVMTPPPGNVARTFRYVIWGCM